MGNLKYTRKLCNDTHLQDTHTQRVLAHTQTVIQVKYLEARWFR